MKVAEVAAILKLNQQTVRNWIDAATLPAVGGVRRLRIKRSDFERLFERAYSGDRTANPSSGGAVPDGEIPEMP